MYVYKQKPVTMERCIYVLNVGKQSFTPKRDISKMKGPTIVYKNYIVKVVGASRQVGLNILRSFDQAVFQPQFAEGLLAFAREAQDAWKGCKILLKMCTSIGYLQGRCNFNTAKFSLSDFTLSLLSLLTTGYDLYQSFSCVKLLSFLLNIYQIYSGTVAPLFTAQSLDALFLATASTLLPTKVYEIFKRISVFSSTRIGDDVGFLHRLFAMIVEFFSSIFTALNFTLPEQIQSAFKVLSEIGAHHVIIERSKKLLALIHSTPRLLLERSINNEISELHEQWLNCGQLVDWCRRSATVQQLKEDFARLFKRAMCQKNVTRVEPCCFVFEGPPGCLKSVTMNLVVQAMRTTVYSHQIKSVSDGKDFYDSYNNEEIFVMDDLGQQGPSQFRTLINMVSAVKMPLDCAEAKLKDTKFLTSPYILFTSNSFMTLNNISKQDCIQNREALWRRGNVFDFAKVRMYNGKLKGRLSYKYFDIRENVFKEGFHADVKKYFKDNNIHIDPYFSCENDVPRIRYIKWMVTIIKGYNTVKMSQEEQGVLSEEELQELDDAYENWFDTQGESAFNYCEPIEEVEDIDDFSYDYDVKMDTFVEDKETPMEIINKKGYYTSIFMEMVEYASGQMYELASIIHKHSFGLCVALGLLQGIGQLVLTWMSYKREAPSQVIENIVQQRVQSKKEHTSVTKINKNVLYACFHAEQDDLRSSCIVSGHCVIAPAHIAVNQPKFISIFQKGSQTHKIIDHLSIEQVYMDAHADVVIFKLPYNIPLPFKQIHAHIKPTGQLSILKASQLWFSTICGSFPLGKSLTQRPEATLVYSNGNWKNVVPMSECLTYDFGTQGLCGSPVIDEFKGVIGFHVAGTSDNKNGSTIIWSEKVKSQIHDILAMDDKFIVEENLHAKEYVDTSGMRIESPLSVYTNQKSNIIKSPIYGVFPVERFPANLAVDGAHTIKTVGKKSMTHVRDVSFAELEFAKQMLLSMMPSSYGALSEQVVVKGNDWLCGLNSKSSNGFKCLKEKSAYVDFDKGMLTPLGKQEIDKLECDIINGTVKLEDIVWTECLKDELKNANKVDKPRSFRISRIHIQILTKKYTGALVQYIMENRDFNQVMIGVNPFKEWGNMYNRLKSAKEVWDADIGVFDGNMLPQVQALAHDVILSVFQGSESEKKVLSFVLRNMSSCPVLFNDDLWLTTHSMPSGSFLTAMLNSCINKCYTAMWYYREEMRAGNIPQVRRFWEDIDDFVYGDDKVNTIRVDKKHLNAVTMRNFFESIGMTFTDAQKQPVVHPFSNLDAVTFLKRSFKFHPSLNRIMCPLELKTLTSGLSWIDQTKDSEQVMQDKIHCFQRELYLHEPHVRFEYVNTLKKACLLAEVPFTHLSDDYMHYVYNNDQVDLEGYSWHGSKYV